MKDVILIGLKAWGVAGVAASFIVALWPVWVLLQIQKPSVKLGWKFLALGAFGGWVMIGRIALQGMGFGSYWMEMLILPFMAGVVSTIYVAMIRGEQVARFNGEIEDHHGTIRRISKKEHHPRFPGSV